jgi:hypothetical protein
MPLIALLVEVPLSRCWRGGDCRFRLLKILSVVPPLTISPSTSAVVLLLATDSPKIWFLENMFVPVEPVKKLPTTTVAFVVLVLLKVEDAILRYRVIGARGVSYNAAN